VSEKILDGKGKGYEAGVTVHNRLMTTGIDLSLTEAASESGDTYNLASVQTTLSTAGESALFYLKNNESTNLIITSIIVNIMDYVGTDGQPILRVLRNPTGGDIVSTETAAEELNRNYGSKKTLDADIFTGIEGDTMTGNDGRVLVNLPTTAAVTFLEFADISVLPKGASIGLTYQPPAGVTTVDVTVAVTATLNGTQL